MGGGGMGGGGGAGGGGGGMGGSGGYLDPNIYCLLESRYPTNFPAGTTEARLFLVSPADRHVQDASKCMSLHACGDGGRGGFSQSCMASDLNQQLDGAMPNGLGSTG
jgi:hypothetical protein